ncbi:unnamed protein product [Victoria cruziana]
MTIAGSCWPWRWRRRAAAATRRSSWKPMPSPSWPSSSAACAWRRRARSMCWPSASRPSARPACCRCGWTSCAASWCTASTASGPMCPSCAPMASWWRGPVATRACSRCWRRGVLLELSLHRQQFPQLVLEQAHALYFPYPVYFWVRKDNQALAARIERGLNLALADGSFRRLFEQYHAKEIALLRQGRRQIHRLRTPAGGGRRAERAEWRKLRLAGR